MKKINIKRIYDAFDKTDGYRVLVDRLWPRGISKSNSHIDLWLKDIAPSTELREWFNHKPENWVEFKKRYGKELSSKIDLINIIFKNAHNKPITLLYSAKDQEHNNAVVLSEYLKSFKK